MYKSMCVFNKDGEKGEERYELGSQRLGSGVLGRVGEGSIVSFCVFVLISVFCVTGD